MMSKIGEYVALFEELFKKREKNEQLSDEQVDQICNQIDVCRDSMDETERGIAAGIALNFYCKEFNIPFP